MTLLSYNPSEYFSRLVKMDDGKPVNWHDYHYKDLIDRPFIKRLVLRTSRQVGKSSFSCLYSLKLAHVPMFRIGYVSPSQKQTEEFSKLRLGKILTINPELRSMLLSNKSPLAVAENMRATSILNDLYIKVFATGASMKLGYAADEQGVERVRGGSLDALLMDETQSMLLDVLNPVLDPMLDSSDYRIKINMGTPLDPDDDLCQLFDTTSQHTMVVKCHHCNKHTTLNHLKQIHTTGVLCYHCMKPIDIRTAFLIPLNPESTVLGIHFNKLMMPGIVYNPIKYQDLLDKVYAPNRNDNKLYNEELGIPKSSSASILVKADVAACRVANLTYDPDADFDKIFSKYTPPPGSFLVVGIDWGGGANDQSGGDTKGKSHTAMVAVLMSMKDDRIKMRLMWHKLYPLPQVKEAVEDVLLKAAHMPAGTIFCPDFGGGAYGNSALFGVVNSSVGKNFICLPVRGCQLINLIEYRKEQYRVDVDRSFIISTFVKKKIMPKLIELPNNDAAYQEVENSFMAMKNFTDREDPGKTMWVLKHKASNDIFMAKLYSWVGFCALKGLFRDIMM